MSFKGRSYNSIAIQLTLQKFEMAVLGEFICALSLVIFVYQQEDIIMAGWAFLELCNVIYQLTVVYAYKRSNNRAPKLYTKLYIIGMLMTMMLFSLLPFLYDFKDDSTILVLAIVYISLISGGALFHCYVKYIHVLYCVSLFLSYATYCFMQSGVIFYLGYGSILFMFAICVASILIQKTFNFTMRLEKVNELRGRSILRFNKKIYAENARLMEVLLIKQGLERELLKNNDLLHQISTQYEKENDDIEKQFHWLFESQDIGLFVISSQGGQLSNKKLIQFFPDLKSNFKALPTILPEFYLDNHLFRTLFPLTLGHRKSSLYMNIQTVDSKYYRVQLKVVFHGITMKNMWLFEDVTQETLLKKKSKASQYYDHLTGLGNRRLISEKLESFSQECLRSGFLISLIFIDLDEFKMINDTYGHELGNQILCQFASRLKQLESDDVVAGRMGGDEFVILVKGILYKEELFSLLQNILNIGKHKFRVNDKDFLLTSSIGASFFPSDTSNSLDLFRLSDLAMYHTKELGKNNYTIYRRVESN